MAIIAVLTLVSGYLIKPLRIYYPLVVLMFLAGAANGVMDTLTFHYPVSVFSTFDNQQFVNPMVSWENKYEKDSEGNLVQPLKAKFIGATTFLVFVTDLWHFAKMFMLTCFWASIILHPKPRYQKRLFWMLVAVMDYIAFTAGFTLFYSWLLII
ncbi:MAG: hypothetical protein HC874_14280 [Richelia sp. SL_2_1]|nr:hypothetical protein [Richelia sp. SL_2_1]